MPWLLLLLCLHAVFVVGAEKLYYYGQPTLTADSGFIKMDPSNMEWEVAAQGFATDHQNPEEALSGVVLNSDSTDMLMYGAFSLWNETYVGCILRIDPQTLQPSKFNNGILGEGISGMTYFNNGSNLAVVGDFLGFQQNPGVEIKQIGGCTADGKTCYRLGQGLNDFRSSGKLRSIGSVIYVLYTSLNGGAKVASFDSSSNNPNQVWKEIYSSSAESPYMSLEVYLNSLWLFGWVQTTHNQTVSAARWNFIENSWEYFLTSGYFGLTKPVLNPACSISPDGLSAYITIPSYSTSKQVYKWSQQDGIWVPFYAFDSFFEIAIGAMNDGVAVGGDNVQLAYDGYNKSVVLSEMVCGGPWLSLAVSSDNSKLYGFCSDGGIGVSLYDMSQLALSATKNVTNLEQMLIKLQAMCIYGDKMFISGVFENVGNISARRMAIWDNKYERWYPISNEIVTVCHCSADGTDLAVVCSQNALKYPLLMLDSASTDNGVGDSAQMILRTNLTDIIAGTYVGDIDYVAGTVYIAAGDGTINVSLSRWSESAGVETLTTGKGTNYNELIVHGHIIYVTGKFMVNNSTQNAARFNMSSGAWMPMDQLYQIQNTSVKPGTNTNLVYWDLTDKIYVSGLFNRIGTMRVSNWGGYNLEGQAEDSVAGGVPDLVYNLQPMEYRMYLITRRTDCAKTLANSCGMLLYYDGLLGTYSYVITQGVGIIAAGDDSRSDADSSDDSVAWEVVLILSSILFAALLVALAAILFYRRVWSKRSAYQEIPDFVKSLASLESIAPIDFQYEDFVMKSVLGRGAYGTVWSCVFPQREGGTYAVKQMLFSKGETKKIDIVKQEIDILEKFRHPHIVHYCGHRVETTQTSVEFFIFMELYEQPCSLKGVIQKRAKKAEKSGMNEWFTYEEVKVFLFQISDGLNYLQHNGVAHRDLKCANILVKMKGSSVRSLHIADFGISKIMSEEGGINVLASTVLGTPSFMAPEIFKNQPYDAFKADMWSFGMLLYEMLSWKEPEIPGQKPVFPQHVTEIMNQDHHFLSVLEIFDKCTQMDANNRPTPSELLSLCENLP